MSWQLTSFLILGGALALGFAWYERSRPSARVLALVAALAALAVVGRIAFAPFPNVKPTTDIVLFAGYALGGAPGFAVGAVTALVSNIFFSHGPWTPWQMAAWGGVGMAGGALGAVVRRGWSWRQSRAFGDQASSEPRELGRWGLALACGLAGLGFGVVMDLYLWTLGAEQTLASYVVLSARSLPFNVAHILGNVAFCLIIGPPLVRALRRYRRRFEVRWAAPGGARAGVPAGLVALALVFGGTGLLTAPAAEADSAGDRATRYLLGSQNRDGGFGGSRGAASNRLHTGWAALGLAAAGRNPRDVERGGKSVIDHLKSNPPRSDDTGGLSRTILVVRAAGLSPRRFAGQGLYAKLLKRRDKRVDGSFDGLSNQTAFGVMAMRAAGESRDSRLVRESAQWLTEQQNSDNGFGYSRGRSEVDVTGAALEAFAAAGRGGDARDAAVTYLKQAQLADGGYGKTAGASSSNAQSTAWAVRGLAAVGRGGGRLADRAVGYLRRRQGSDGSVSYSAASSQTPVWVTADAGLAFGRKSLPLAPVPRRVKPPAPRASAKPEAGGGGGKPSSNAGDDETASRPSRRSRSGRGRRRANGAGTGVGAGKGSGGRATISGAGAAAGPAFPIGSTAVPTAASPFSVPGLSGAIGAAGALAPPIPALPNPLAAKPPKRPEQPSPTENRGTPRTPVAANKPLGARGDKPGPKVGAGAGALLLVLIAAGLLLATGGGARARRLWAAARRRTT